MICIGVFWIRFMIKKLMVVVFLCFLSSSLLASELKEIVKNDVFLSSGMTGVVEHDHVQYLVSVGVSVIKSPTPSAMLTALKEAKIRAKSELSKFVNHVSVDTKEVYVSKTVIRNGERTTAEVFQESIKELSSGVLREAKEVGWWKEDGELLYVLGIKI